MTHPIVQEIEKAHTKKKVPSFNIGDITEVRTRVVEGDKERIQPFIGTVIARKGSGPRETFTVRRIVQGEGVERVFVLHSPNLVDIRVRHEGQVRRAKLYYLRDRVGKATRVKGRVVHETARKKSAAAKTEEAPEPEPNEDAKAAAEQEEKTEE